MKKNICEDLLNNKYTNEQMLYLIMEANHLTSKEFLYLIRNYCQSSKVSNFDYDKLMAIYYYVEKNYKDLSDKTNTKWYKTLIKILNYKYTNPHDLYTYMTDTLNFPMGIFISYTESYRRYFPNNKITYNKLLDIVELLKKEKSNNIKMRQQENSKKRIINLKDEASYFAKNFINSNMPLSKYLNSNDISKTTAKKYRDSLKLTDEELYKKLLSSVELKQQVKTELLKEKCSMLIYILKANNCKINLLDYYKTIKIDINSIVNVAKNFLDANDMLYINRFFRSKPEILLFEEDALNEVITLDARIVDGDIVEGSGQVVDKKTKMLALNYLKNNHLPLRTDLYYDCIKKIIDNKLDVNEKVDSIYEEYVTRLKHAEFYKEKEKKKC